MPTAKSHWIRALDSRLSLDSPSPVTLGASSGDSAVLVISDGKPATQVTAGQFKNPPVGSRMALFMPFAVKLNRPWLVLAMADGVWKYVGWDRIVEEASRARGQALLPTLQNIARLGSARSFQDDFTIVCFEAAS